MSNKNAVMTDEQLRDRIETICRQNPPTSFTCIGKALGYDKISGSMVKRIRKLIPGIEKLFSGGKAIPFRSWLRVVVMVMLS